MNKVSGPAPHPYPRRRPTPLPGVGSESFARRFSALRRAIEPGHLVSPSWVARLDLYNVHPLIHRLRPYQPTAKPSLMQRATWQTLVYWQQLIDTTELELDLMVPV